MHRLTERGPTIEMRSLPDGSVMRLFLQRTALQATYVTALSAFEVRATSAGERSTVTAFHKGLKAPINTYKNSATQAANAS